MGVTECDNMLMLLGVSNKMTEKVGAHKCCLDHDVNMCVNDTRPLCNIVRLTVEQKIICMFLVVCFTKITVFIY